MTTRQLASETGGPPVEVVSDQEDDSNQSLLLQYQSVIDGADEYVRPLVRIESGAKSALEPNERRILVPYVAEGLAGTDLSVPGVSGDLPRPARAVPSGAGTPAPLARESRMK